MKNYLLLLFLLFSSSAFSHVFGPASMHNARGSGSHTYIVMQITSKWSGFYSFSVGGETLKDQNGNPVQQYVIAGIRADFPIKINNKYIVNDHILICSWENREDVTFRQEVCFNVKV